MAKGSNKGLDDLGQPGNTGRGSKRGGKRRTRKSSRGGY